MALHSHRCQQRRVPGCCSWLLPVIWQHITALKPACKVQPKEKTTQPGTSMCSLPPSAMHIRRLRYFTSACHTSPALLPGGPALSVLVLDSHNVRLDMTPVTCNKLLLYWYRVLSRWLGWAKHLQPAGRSEDLRCKEFHITTQFSRHKFLFWLIIPRNP